MSYGFYPTYFQPQPQQEFFQNQNTQQMRNGGFVSVPNEGMVNSYPVAPGNCVTFKIEGQPIVMEKSMGFSQLESPKIERYRLVKEDTPEASNSPQTGTLEDKAVNTTIDNLKSEIEAIWKEIDGIKNTPKRTTNSKREKDGDD